MGAANPTRGLGTVPTEIEQAAISAATGEVCASGALSTVVNDDTLLVAAARAEWRCSGARRFVCRGCGRYALIPGAVPGRTHISCLCRLRDRLMH